jgi:hypothetical protein
VCWTLIRPRQQSAVVAEASQRCDSLPLSSLARRDAVLHLGQFRLHCRTPTLCHRQPLADVALDRSPLRRSCSELLPPDGQDRWNALQWRPAHWPVHARNKPTGAARAGASFPASRRDRRQPLPPDTPCRCLRTRVGGGSDTLRQPSLWRRGQRRASYTDSAVIHSFFG